MSLQSVLQQPAPEQTNTIAFADGTKVSCNLLCDVMHLEGAECLAAYEENFYAGMPAIAKNRFDKGITYYLGTNMHADGIRKVLDLATEDAGVKAVIAEETELEVPCRNAENCTYYFLFNFKDHTVAVPKCFIGCKDMLTGETVTADQMMKPYDTLLVSIPR